MLSNEKVSINILHYNSFEKTKQCILSCMNQKKIDYEIIVIDNHSSNDSLDSLKDYFKEHRIDYLENKDNYGYAKGNNIGVQYALDKGIRYSLLLNNDITLAGDYVLEKLVKVMETYGCAVAAPYIYNVTADGLELNQNDSAYLKLLRLFRVLPENKVYDENVQEVSEAQGSALLVDNREFVKAGGFPEHYFMYGEEGCFAKKLLCASKKILWYRDEKDFVLHHHDKTNSVNPWRVYLMGRNRALEYYENRRASFFRWKLVFTFFYLSVLVQKNRVYLSGMKCGKKLVKKKSDYEAIYRHAKEVRTQKIEGMRL